MNQPQVYTYSLPFEPPPSPSPPHLSGWIQSPWFADEWIKQLWYIYTAEYYSATKRSTLESVPLRWMTLPFLSAAHPTPVGLDLRERRGGQVLQYFGWGAQDLAGPWDGGTLRQAAVCVCHHLHAGTSPEECPGDPGQGALRPVPMLCLMGSAGNWTWGHTGHVCNPL